VTHPELAARGSFEHLRLGRKRPRGDPRTLQFANYVTPAAADDTPTTCDYGDLVAEWPMYRNHELQDCTCAAAGHMIQAWSAEAGSPRTPTPDDVEELYWKTGNPSSSDGRAGGPTDDGRDELTVLNYWRQNGLGDDKIYVYVKIDPADLDNVRTAVYLFGGVYTMQALPETAKDQPVWEVVGDGATGPSRPASWGDHAVPYVAYGDGSFTCITWGAPHELSERFHRAYAKEVYALISPDFFARAGQMLDTTQLEADLLRVTQ
jgi:hypothetical protein